MTHENKLMEYCRVIEQLCNTIEDGKSSTGDYSNYLDKLCALRGHIMHCKFLYLQSLPPTIDNSTAMKVDKLISYIKYCDKRSKKCTKNMNRSSDNGHNDIEFGDLSSCKYSELYGSEQMMIELGECGSTDNNTNSELYSDNMPIYQIRGYNKADKHVLSIQLDSVDSDDSHNYRHSQIDKSGWENPFLQLGGLADSQQNKTYIFLRKDCGACQQLEPQLNKYMAGRTNNIVKMHQGDEHFSELSSKYNINVVPTMIHGDTKISGSNKIMEYLNRI
jgi:hypothetical protein